jgi:hypothetical protein
MCATLCEMETTTFRTITACILVAAISLTGCGGSDVTESSPPPSATATAMVVTRTGGFAGVNDVVEIAADGTAQITSKTGETQMCTPDSTAVERLGAIDLASVGSATSKSQIADGFVYSVRSASGAATAGEGDNQGTRAEFVLAAAAVVSSCLEHQSPETE